jgi:putative SOS response-associated peptidase YedK
MAKRVSSTPEQKGSMRHRPFAALSKSAVVAQIHNRMPVILPPENHEQWLSGEVGKEILRPFPANEMTARPISKRINKTENNDPSVLEAGEIEQVERLI